MLTRKFDTKSKGNANDVLLLAMLSFCILFFQFCIVKTVYSAIKGPSQIEGFVGENARFMWNTTDGKKILSATWGLRNGEMADPQFINVNARNYEPRLNPNMPDQYVGRVQFIGHLRAAHAWFMIKNLTIQDSNEYTARISDEEVEGFSSYHVRLVVKNSIDSAATPTQPASIVTSSSKTNITSHVTTLILLTAFLYLCISFVMTSQCNVFSSTYGYYLKNNLLRSISHTSLQTCTASCVNAEFCRSTNFHFDSQTCELNSADKHDFPHNYTKRHGYSYSGWQAKKPFPRSCSEAKEKTPSAKSGYYLIQTKRKILKVYCDMENHDGGWTLVVSISAKNRDHLQRAENNCPNDSVCVELKTNDIQARKLSDEDIIDIISETGTFRVDRLSSTPGTVFYRLPNGSSKFDSSCTGSIPPICPRMIISHHYPYKWESNPCNSIHVGYRIYKSNSHCVFDGHDDYECDGNKKRYGRRQSIVWIQIFKSHWNLLQTAGSSVCKVTRRRTR